MSEFGIKVWEADQSVLLDPSKRIARYLGSFSTGTSAGNRTVSIPPDGGQLFFFTQGATGDMRASYANIALNGLSFSWTFTAFRIVAGASFPAALTIHYGVF